MKLLLIILLLPLTVFFSQSYGKPVRHKITYQDTAHVRGIVKMVEIQTPKGQFHVWTKRFGNNPKIKVLLLHGGPGGTHEIFESFEHFFPQTNIEFIEYDQLESYYSDKPNDSTLWNTKHFVEEVEQVRKALNLTHDNFYLLGHSWGGILAIEYALKYQQNLKGLIISNMMASVPAYAKYNAVLRSQMRKSLVDSLTAYEDKGLYQDSTYQSLLINEFYKQHLCRLAVWPEPIMQMLAHLNDKIYVSMQGPSEFKTGGTLINWDRSGDLHLIKVPTLVIGAKYDTQDPQYMEWMSTKVKNGAYLYCPEGSHSAMWDDQEHYFPGLISFIKKVNQGTFKSVSK
ncbi:proline iminopeptidase-family hydrolase [Mucilaginibacter ginsenosidivorax]|uniref:Alpha/beta fold hydrolase n=1 Tax=Mucilaginibacter ginsenosidivorax TaxID=862126 RepID=A0A5B8W4Q2_9SPHI|nr:proline iminopeptidase-family hydrolase [Mucilaginibacter ginsenosidivorax]QEC78529.1 alpha/beta fold hydrolase [Mucilaginibacter ginsenosidivorax]